jgi:hypothetical protein
MTTENVKQFRIEHWRVLKDKAEQQSPQHAHPPSLPACAPAALPFVRDTRRWLASAALFSSAATLISHNTQEDTTRHEHRRIRKGA